MSLLRYVCCCVVALLCCWFVLLLCVDVFELIGVGVCCVDVSV